MIKKINVMCIYWSTLNIHLIKEVGMIPYSLFKYYNCEAKIVLNKEKEYPYLDKEVKGLVPVYRYSKLSPSWGLLFSMIKNIKNLDLLMAIHPSFANLIIISLFLTLRKNGKAYVHLDCLSDENGNYGLLNNKNRFYQKVFRYLILPKGKSNRILWGGQYKGLINKIQGQYPFINTAYIPDGFMDLNHSSITFSFKKNVILTVGRIGSIEKRSDILLEGFRMICDKIDDWQLIFIGPIEASFKVYIDNYFTNYPFLKDKVTLLGEINDRDKLYLEYEKAKIFCMTSDYESFGIASVEALSRGCTIITSDYPAAYDITNSGKYGVIFKKGDVQDFSDKLQETINDAKKMEMICELGQVYAEANFSYKGIVKPIYDWITIQDETQ